MGKNQHVTPKGNMWQVKGAGNTKATAYYPTQQEAFNKAKTIATNQNSEVLIHGKNGQIRAKHSYGKDPFPPRE